MAEILLNGAYGGEYPDGPSSSPSVPASDVSQHGRRGEKGPQQAAGEEDDQDHRQGLAAPARRALPNSKGAIRPCLRGAA